MERLTKGNGDMAWYKGEYKGKKLFFEPYEVMSDCSSLDISKILRRLAAYEETGFTPEEIKDMTKKAETMLLTWFEAKYGFPVGKLMDFCEAEQQGRLVVEPCKPGEKWKDENGNIVTIKYLSYTHSRNHIGTMDMVVYKYEEDKDDDDEYAVNWIYFKKHFARVEQSLNKENE